MGRIKMDVDFEVNKATVTEVKKALQEFQNQIDKVGKNYTISDELKKASNSAKELSNILNDSWNTKLNQLDLSKLNNSINKTFGSVNNLKKILEDSGSGGAVAFNTFSRAVLNTNLQLSKSNKLLDDMADTMSKTVKWGIASSIFNNITNSIQKAYDYTVKLDTSLNDIRIVTGKSADEMERFAVRANQVAKDLGRSTKDFTEASLIYYQQGLGNEEAQARAEVTMKAANVTGQTGKEVSEQLTAVWNGYKVTAEEAELYVDKLAAVAAGTAADLEELSTGMSKVASAANIMGVDVDQLNAQLATIVSVTRQAPESVGVALKTIYARMSDIKSGLDDETTLGNYTEKMAEYGVNVLNANGQLRDMGEVIEEIGNKWNNLSREQQVALSQTMAGTRQYNNLLSLFDNWDMYTQSLEMSANAAGTLQKQQDIYMESTAAHLKQLSTEAERTYDILFDQDTVNGFADALTGLLGIFNNLLAGLGGGTNDFIYFGSIVTNIFKKQIAEGINNTIDNIDKMKQNIASLNLMREIVDAGKSTEVDQPQYVDNDLQRAEELLQVQKYISNEKFNELNALRQEITENEAILEYLYEKEDIVKSTSKEEANQNYKNASDAYKKQIDSKNKILSLTKKINATENQEDKKDDIKSLQKEIDLLNQQKLNQADANRLKEIKNSLIKSGQLSEEQVNQLEKLENKTLVQLNNEMRDRLALSKAVTAAENDAQEEIQETLNKQQALYKTEIDTNSRKGQITELVQGFSTLVSLLTTISGIVKTLNDEDLTAGEKAERIITTLVASLPMVIMNFSSLIGIIPNLIALFTGLSTAEFMASKGAATLAGAIWAAIAPLLPIILPIVGAIGLLTAGIVALISASQAEQKEIDGMREAAKQMSEQAEETKKTIDGLKSALNGYEDAVKTLKACTEGTDEWNTALQDVNNTVLDILEKYPQLAKIQGLVKRDSDTGLLSIDKSLLNQYQRALEQRYISQRAGAVTAYAQADKKQAEKDSKDLLNSINSRFKMLQQSGNQETLTWGNRSQNNTEFSYAARQRYTNPVDFLSNDQLKQLSEVSGVEELYNKKVQEFTNELVKAGKITEEQSKTWVSTMETYREKISELSSATENAKNEIDNAAKVAASNALGPNATNTQQQMFAKVYSDTYEKERKNADTLLRKGLSRFSGVNNDSYESVLKQYDEAMGGGVYSKAHSSNPVRGNNGQNGIYFWNRETQQDEKLDREVVIDTIAAYNAAQNAENAKTYKEAEDVLKKVAEAGSIDEDLADRVLSKTFDVNELTQDEYNKIKENKDKIEAALTDDQFAKIGQESAEKFKINFEDELNKWDPEQAAKNAQERFKSSLEAAGTKAEKLFDLDTEEFKDFGQYLADIADESDKLADSMDESADATAVVTQSIMRMNRGIESLADGWEDWSDVLKKSSKESQEYWEALKDTQDALADLLDVEEDAKKYFDDDFIAENMNDISEAAEGNADAIDRLRDSFADELILKIAIDNNLTDDIKNQLVDSVNDLQAQIPNIDIGYTINPNDESYGQFLQTCQDIINTAKMTKEQANAMFEAMGFQATYKTEEQPTTYSVPIYTTYVRSHKTRDEDTGLKETGWEPQQETMTVQTGSQVLTGEYATFAMSTSTPDGGGGIPTITGLTKKATGSMNNYSSANKGGGSPGNSGKSGGSGGGSKKADSMDPVEREADRYHDVDVQLDLIDKDLDKLDKQKKKLFGQDLINNLNKRLGLLNKQIDVTNEKIRIARGETQELRDKLSGKGVSFNADGTIANYAQAYVSQLNYVNSLINQYNSMSAEAQEGFKDTVDKAKEDFDKFVDNIDRYDELITDMIPGLEADIQEAVDEKIDLQIEKFDMEIELRLNMAEAERDWNEFKKKIIDGIEDDDVLGNAMARLVDFSSYYKEDNTGIVQALRKQVDNTLAELAQMDKTGQSNIYGDNRTAALDDLKKYYEELMNNLKDVLELQKEIHESYIDMMDEAQEKFDEQIEAYEMISDLIEHDMEVISLVYGEQSYGQLAKYYNKQQQNFNSQLDFQRQQADFWRQQLDTLEEGSDEWENARDKWKDAVESMNDLIEKSIQNLQGKYLNAINLIFQNLNNKITDNLGLEYIEEEWNLINKNADQYLDTINSLYEVQKLESKYLDALDQTDSISAQRQLKKIMDEELADLRERDKLTQYDIERANKKYEIALKQIALQEAQQNKSKMRLRRDSQGNYRYEYTADGDQISQLQDELNDMYNSLYNFDKARYQDNLNQMYDVWVEFQEKMAEAAQINDPVARSERELLLQSQYEQLINGLTEQNATVRENLHESAFDDLSRLYDVNVSNFQNMSDQEKEVLMGDLLPYWESGVQHMTDVFAGEGGFLGVCKDAFDQLHDATKDYEDGLDELENTGRISFESIGEGIDENINRTQQLISDNTELINTYEQELTAIGNVIAQLDGLIDKYNAAKDAAIAATKAAYEYWSEQQRQAAAAAGNANGGSGSGNGNSGSGSNSGSSGKAGGSGSGGDGNLVMGDTATFSGSYYYDSYGTSPVGSKYSGVANGVVVDRITNNPYGIHIHSADGRYPDLGWVKKSQLSGYDTGGYTGEWGSDGRLALLHQKELVLNKEDTANMLNAISIMRNITNMLGSSVLGKLAAATAGGLGTEVGGDVLEQNVHIDAQFPNVKDSREIEEALNNLVNMASMRANRR